MNIGFDARLFQKGQGLGRYVEQLLLQYDKMDLVGHTLTVFLSEEGMVDFVPKNARIKTVLAPFRWYSIQEQLFFPRLLNQHKLDVVHFPHFNVPIWYKKPFIVTIHDLILLKMPRSARLAATTRLSLIYDIKYAAYQYVLRRAVKQAKKIIVPTDYVKRDIISALHCDETKITRIYEAAMDVPACSAVSSNNSIKPYMLYVGNAYPHKNLELLLKVAHSLKKESSDMRIVMVGQEDYFAKELRLRIIREDLQSFIEHRGFVSEEALSELYCNALAYVFPSQEEGFGLPGLEAMSYGLPVIASSASCLPEVYAQAALYASPDDPTAWLEIIKKIRYNSVLRTELQKMGFARVSQFSWAQAAKETLKILTTRP